ncbi:enolase-phosphatase E1 [Izhakiella capsodis]|uniref:Enolase-phosphatase E1 n=1 Tax=Izhakiella capsodis TaxID=1367852 RepID=A0A1I4YL79_9GAMM|nr:acireductone synthase [Izhakiella capsodis]SFN38764.1 enolase-phosphatase E1 [Izhakiella capsodis]
MIRAIVTDIEGTTSDIRFVHQVLFPFARKHLEPWLTRHQHEALIAHSLDDLRQELGQPQASQAELITALYAFMDQDRKSPALKALQGMIWRDGYLNGDFTGDLYADVPPALRAWQQRDIILCVYSSGSVAAQKLLFGYSDAGDLTGLFSHWFDTHVGGKREVTSYRNIQQQLGLPPQELLFLSDIHQELDAARSAGWHTLQLVRDQPDTGSTHRQVASFAEINPELLPI